MFAGKSALDKVLIAGTELRKHLLDGDSLVRLDNELCEIKQRYDSLVTRCGDHLVELAGAAPGADTFYISHEQVLSWLQFVESEMKSDVELCFGS